MFIHAVGELGQDGMDLGVTLWHLLTSRTGQWLSFSYKPLAPWDGRYLPPKPEQSSLQSWS